LNTPGKGLLKTVSILFIVFGAIATVVSLAGVVGSAALTALGGAVGTALGGILLVALFIMLAVSILELIVGIIGVNRAGNPAKANFFITTGIILGVLSIVPLIIGASTGSFPWMSLISFILPILYIMGGFMNKSAAAAT
jgi:hypothetical protein